MTEELKKDLDAGTELGRSPSGVPASEARRDTPLTPPSPREGGEVDSVKEAFLDWDVREDDPEDPPTEPAASSGEGPPKPWPFCAHRRRGVLVKKDESSRKDLTPEERLLALDTWKRSGLPAGDFAALLGLSKHTLYNWKSRFEKFGPAGLMDRKRGGPRGSRLPEITRRTILMLKESNPDWGIDRISAMLLRGPALPASPGAVAKVLHEEGYMLEEVPTRPHPDKPREFERSEPNGLWQTDLFTFVLKRQNRRVYLVAFMDDHSRFIVAYGLHASQSAALVIEVLRSGIASYQTPAEILTDNGAQYVTWRGKSAFTRECERRGIRQIVAKPRRPQTLGKIERFWGTLWRESVERAIFLDLADAQRRIGLFIDHYNFQRPHTSLGGLVPADRFFHAAPDVLRTLKERVAANALEVSRNGIPRAPFYLTGNAGGQPFSVHAEGERVILRRGEGEREEVELTGPEAKARPNDASSELPEPLCPTGSPSLGDPEAEHEEVPGPGGSPWLENLADLLGGGTHGGNEEGGDAP